MIFPLPSLPILTRELRVQARRPWTAWLRVVIALLATLMGMSILAWAQRTAWQTRLPGRALFDSLSSILVVFCLVEGVRQTADALSRERREGTLGLLFLTDLRGLDVVLGKLAASSLASGYAFLAVFPVLAVSLTAGGVTGGEFWRTVLALLNTLFLALAAGLWTSAHQREEGRALLRGLVLVFSLTFLPWILEPFLRPQGWPNLSLSVALQLAGDTPYGLHPGRFWGTLALGHLLGWALLAAAGRRVETSWRKEGDDAAEPERGKANVSACVPRPPRKVPADPAEAVQWLARQTWSHRRVIWGMMGCLLLGPLLFFPGFLTRMTGSTGILTAVHYTTSVLPLLVILFLAARPLAEARRGGGLELLLATPLSPAAIVDGYWRALWQGAPVVMSTVILTLSAMVFGPVVLSNSFGMDGYILSLLLQSVRAIVGGLAACWLGLYLGLRTQSAVRATGFGLLGIVAVPWVLSSLFWSMAGPQLLFSLVQLLPTFIGLIWLTGLLLWSRRELFRRFRELALAPG